MKAKQRTDRAGAAERAAQQWGTANGLPDRRAQRARIVFALAGLMTFILLNGCATRSTHSAAGLSNYNFIAGYPAVGASE